MWRGARQGAPAAALGGRRARTAGLPGYDLRWGKREKRLTYTHLSFPLPLTKRLPLPARCLLELDQHLFLLRPHDQASQAGREHPALGEGVAGEGQAGWLA